MPRLLILSVVTGMQFPAGGYAAMAGPAGERTRLGIGQDDCTIGVTSGVITRDGRPILWKVRDIAEDARQQLVHVPATPHSYIGVCSEGEGIYMGLNDAGVASGNSLVRFTSIPAPNSSVQGAILRCFATIDEIEDYFRSEQQVGVCQVSGCFPFIDAGGKAKMFEIERSNSLWIYDSLAPSRQAQRLYGFVVRANEFHMRGNALDNVSIGGRYASGVHNVLGLILDRALSARTLVQGHAGSQDHQEFLRYGPGRELATISRDTTRSAVVVHGNLPDEDPALATMWVLLGQTNYSIAVPTWVCVSEVPRCLADGLMYDRARSLWIKNEEAVTQASILPMEAHLFDVVEGTLLPHWRAYGVPDVAEVGRVEHRMAEDAYSLLDCLDNRQDDNKAPTVSFKASPHALTCGFTPIADDHDGVVIAVRWDFGDGCSSADRTPWHTYERPGTYLVSCTITDNCGVSTTDWRYYQVPAQADFASDDGQVNLRDFARLAAYWRRTGCAEPDWGQGADLDRNGSVDFGDLSVLSGSWLLVTADKQE